MKTCRAGQEAEGEPPSFLIADELVSENQMKVQPERLELKLLLISTLVHRKHFKPDIRSQHMPPFWALRHSYFSLF